MARLGRQLLILSDTHLGLHTRPELITALDRLIGASGGAEVVLAGDVFDLSLDPRRSAPSEMLSVLMERFPALSASMRAHLARGGRLTILPGNHDESTAEPEAQDALLARLEINAQAPVEFSPWFVRRNGIHIEHGHMYDPDNAPVHPLARWSPETEPLGVALTRRFIARSGALHFAHAHESTPAQALLRAFKLYGPRAPFMIAQYFQTAGQLVLEANEQRRQAAARERSLGSAQLGDFAGLAGLSPGHLDSLIASAPKPTHLSRRDLFMRLYFDRVVASVAAIAGASAALTGSRTGLGLSLAATAYIASSVAKGRSRYTGLPEARLRGGAELVRAVTGAELVVFGHTHTEDEAPGYMNAGSFAFPRGNGRPYVFVDSDGTASRRRLTDLP